MALVPCEKVLLPASIEELRLKYFPDLSKFDTLKLSCGYDPSNLTPAQKIVWKYSGGALIAGRPLDSAIIFMAGVTGSGKSSTINALFEDHDLCKTSSGRSETEHVALIRKQLCVSAESPAVQGYLSFVDVPGIFDTDSTKEARNTAIIRKFRKSELAERKSTTLQIASVRKMVYPNILLFVIDATDERMDGQDSQLARSLQAFKITADLIDEDKNNVIVVLTHVLSLGINKKNFQRKLEERTRIIKDQFRRILNIENVEVVPVENKPEEFRDSDSDDDDNDHKKNEFCKLPNGEISHYNLFQAILRRFDENLDLLGRLLVSRYFSDACPEKTEKAQVAIFDEESSEIEIAEAAEELSSLQIGIVTNTQPVIPFHNFQSMLRGYCPVTEEVKPTCPIIQQPGNMKVVNIGSSNFAVPNYIEVFGNRETRFQKLTFYDKQDYQDHMKQQYGLDAGVKFVVKTHSDGKWVNNGSGSRESSMISVIQEIQMAEFKLIDADAIQLNPKFETELKNLPTNYSDETTDNFRQFFARWGTHLICEQAVGGAIQLNCTVDQASLTREQFHNVNVEVCGFLKTLFAGETDTDYNNSSDRKKLCNFGITNEHLRISGGDPPKFVNLETINPQVLQQWADTVENSPSQLRCSTKLLPYYNFASEEQSSALRRATQDYLANNLTLNTATVTKQILDRNAIADKATAPAVENEGGGCFPKGALVSLANGENLEIENLGQCKTALKTNNLQQTLFGVSTKLRVGTLGSARFCTYLDRIDDQYLEYLALEFDNGKTLTATEDHLIFQCVSDKRNVVVPKRAKYFQVGDKALYFNNNEFETTTVTKTSKKLLIGAYCPLTTCGTLIVDGFLVSSYSNTDSFCSAQAAMLPLKLFCQASNAIQFNSNSVDDLSPKGKFTGIHPYGQFLISLRKKCGSVLKK